MKLTRRLINMYCKWGMMSVIIVLQLAVHPLMSQQMPHQNAQIDHNTIDSLDKNRLSTVLLVGGIGYVGTSVGLYHAWYKGYPQSGFHLYDDTHEWLQMDKMGHVYSSYQQADLAYDALRWTGMATDAAALWSVTASGLFQTTIEVFDGFSSEWGFSLPDMGANLIGLGGWYLQERLWAEQRIRMKYSATVRSYPIISHNGHHINLQERSNKLYGSHSAQRLLKDYNAQTIWMSANIKSLTALPVPSWLNIAVGYGADQLWGGYHNIWMNNDTEINLRDTPHDRYRQYYLSLDVDLSRIDTDIKWLRSLLRILNVIKIPLPTIELTSRGDIHFRSFHF